MTQTVAQSQATCCGCFVQPNAFFNLPQPFTICPTFDTFHQEGLKDDEIFVLNHLCQAWESFIKLDSRLNDDNLEFKTAIHEAQKIIALRVARRANPGIWRTSDEPNAG